MTVQRIFIASALLTSWFLGGGAALVAATAPSDTVRSDTSRSDTSTAPKPFQPAPVQSPIATVETLPLEASSPELQPINTNPVLPPAASTPSSSQPHSHGSGLDGLSVDGAEAFIDRTNYSIGATQRQDSSTSRSTQPQTAAVARSNLPVSVAPVQVGPVSLSSAGIQWSAPAVGSAGLSYFNPKLNVKLMRPFGRMGNENLRFLFPLAIPAPITSLFGWRIHPISGTQRLHTGVDLGAPMGTPVLAAYAGRVMLADMMGGYGLTVALEHNQGLQQTLYAHLSEIFVRPGEMVQQGAAIGRVGSTGASTGPHLHFEARQMLPDGTWVAVDAAEQLQVALGDLVKSLQVAQRPQMTAMQPQPGGQ